MMTIQIYVRDEKTNDTMYCTFTNNKITYETNGEILEVTNPTIINDMTNNILNQLYRNIRSYELTKAVIEGKITIEKMLDIVDKEFGEHHTDFDENTIIISSHIKQ